MSTEDICIAILGEISSHARSKPFNKKVSHADHIASFETSSSRVQLEEDWVVIDAELVSTKVEIYSKYYNRRNCEICWGLDWKKAYLTLSIFFLIDKMVLKIIVATALL